MAFKMKQKLIDNSSKSVLAAFFLTALERSRLNVKEITHRKDRRGYNSIISAANDGVAWKHLQPAIENALEFACEAAVATDTNNAKNKFKEESIRQHIKAYAATP